MIPAVSNSSSATGAANPAATPAVNLSAGEAARRLEVQGQAGDAERASSVVTISAQGARPAAALSGRSALAFEPADANRDDKVTELERWVYALTHPEDKPAPQGAEIGRSASAELKAYEAVARAGRNV